MISQLLGKVDRNVSRRTIYDNKTMFRLSRISVLIVLDDVSDVGQVEKVTGDWRTYGTGSKMIATSRDMQVLRNMCDDVYEVEMLDANHSIQLLQHHMFKQRQPTAEQIELLGQTSQYAQGLPLLLVILGRRLYDKNVIIWRSDLENLRNSPDIGLTKILRSSFDELDDTHKSMFLDIACLLHCSGGDCMEIILKTCGLGSISIIERLIDKAFITFNPYYGLRMHDLLQQMGDEIGKHSRLWKWKEIADVLSCNMGTSHTRKRKIEVISPEMSVRKEIKLQPDAFKDMGRLRILCLRNGCAENMLMSQGLKYLPNELRYLEWKNYPLPSFPRHFDTEKLVELRMRDSNLLKLWRGKQYLPNLKCIDLSASKNLSQLPDLSGALKLETLEVTNCSNIQEIPCSVKQLVELKRLELSFTGLTRCPELSQFKKLEHLSLVRCEKITELPQLPTKLIHLNLFGINIKELPRGIQRLSQLTKLFCGSCKELESLPSNIGELQYLEVLDISFCSKMRSLPTSVGDLRSLVELRAHVSGLTCLPDEIEHLTNLKKLYLNNCTNLKSLPYGIENLTNLEELHLSTCNNLENLLDGVELLANLETLDLSCTNLKSLPDAIVGLANLETLDLSNCTNLKNLSDGIVGLENLRELDLSDCTNLESLPDRIELLYCLKELCLSNCSSLRMIPELPCYLELLHAPNCTSLVEYTPMLSPNPYRGFWFRFWNCTSLQGHAMNHIFRDFILAVSWVLNMESQYNSGENRYVELVLPGSKFPEGWFNNSSSGCEMGCTSFLANTSWRSVADPVAAIIFGVVLAVVAPVFNFPESYIGVKCKWRSESGQELCSRNIYTFGENMGECAVMWLHLVNPSMFCFPETSFHFSIYDGREDEDVLRDNVVILKCGIAPINKFSYTKL